MDLFSTIGVSGLVKPPSFYRPDSRSSRSFHFDFVFFIGFFFIFWRIENIMWYNEILLKISEPLGAAASASDPTARMCELY